MSSTLRGGIAVRFGNGTQAVQLSASSRELLAQFGHLVLQPGLAKAEVIGLPRRRPSDAA